ncbi:hypothetical protein QUF80_16930 [Desulfococcaceae bacterium HSG8]|nr:hypothetical protein [Desulfococcaceae bacterium HSG8]
MKPGKEESMPETTLTLPVSVEQIATVIRQIRSVSSVWFRICIRPLPDPPVREPGNRRITVRKSCGKAAEESSGRFR